MKNQLKKIFKSLYNLPTSCFIWISKIMKDIIVRTLRIIIWWWIAWYMAFVFLNNLVIVNDSLLNNNQFVIIFVWLLWLFMFVMWVFALCMPRAKLVQFIFWIFLILFSSYVLKDNPSKLIFIWDILRVVWVFLMVAWPIWLCVTENCKKKAEEAKIVEIIEV